ncbi:MAG: SoxR reducing system RseC family protein [Bacteroidota bacterium]
MSRGMIEHWGMVQHVDGGQATVVVERTACGVCGHGGHCGMSKHAVGGQAAVLNLPAADDLKAGDFVNVGLPESRLSLAALFGYLFPALATLAGALVGMSAGGTDAATALGAGAGFVGSLVIARVAITFTPGLSPRPQLIPTPFSSSTFSQE